MRERLIERTEWWLFQGAGSAVAIAYLLRLALRFALWGGLQQPWQAILASTLDTPLLALLSVLALQGIVTRLVPRSYSAAVGLLTGGLTFLTALEMLTRYGWPLRWALGATPVSWMTLTGLLLVGAVALNVWQRQRWLRELRGHGIEWTKLWAQEQPYAARRLALRALRYMGDMAAE